MSLKPSTIDELQQCVQQHPRVLARGAGTKSALSRVDATTQIIDMSDIRGIKEYEPNEFTFTALAGTTLAEIDALLAAQGQYLPFDPILMQAGATLGGAVASGLNGSCRLRYGGIRDFLLGVCFVDGTGALIKGGGRVVKNAAGFDLPKLMVGSLGRLGVLTELTLKVFPRPNARLTLRVTCSDLTDAVNKLYQSASSTWELEALDIEPPATLLLRIAGDENALRARAQRIQNRIERPAQVMTDAEEKDYWRSLAEMKWLGKNAILVKVPMTPKRIADFDASLLSYSVMRRYCVAGNLAWLAWPVDRPLDALHTLLLSMDLSGLVVFGPANRIFLGKEISQDLIRRVRKALDPDQRFPEY
ncbi:MAG: FAD-binding protein [Candidatus Omnitrophota bacterium]|nr:MAG: FAD-binding protein [Candidatus Omnitrophota bacterium]